jgi:hypothetical protein
VPERILQRLGDQRTRDLLCLRHQDALNASCAAFRSASRRLPLGLAPPLSRHMPALRSLAAAE